MRKGNKMNMQIDKYTGEQYDADVWYRGEGGCWVNKQTEAEWRKRAEVREVARCEKRNAARVAKGKPRRSLSSFKRSSARYARYLECDCEMTFGEWLKYGWRYGYV